MSVSFKKLKVNNIEVNNIDNADDDDDGSGAMTVLPLSSEEVEDETGPPTPSPSPEQLRARPRHNAQPESGIKRLYVPNTQIHWIPLIYSIYDAYVHLSPGQLNQHVWFKVTTIWQQHQ